MILLIHYLNCYLNFDEQLYINYNKEMYILGYLGEWLGLKCELVLWFIKNPYECAVMW